jgi:NADH dehydrogenase
VAAGSLDANLDEVGYRSHCHRWGYRFFFGALEGVDRARGDAEIGPAGGDGPGELVAVVRIVDRPDAVGTQIGDSA